MPRNLVQLKAVGPAGAGKVWTGSVSDMRVTLQQEFYPGTEVVKGRLAEAEIALRNMDFDQISAIFGDSAPGWRDENGKFRMGDPEPEDYTKATVILEEWHDRLERPGMAS